MAFLELLLIPLGFLFTRKTRDTSLDRSDDRAGRIRCPRCGWEPKAHDLWACEPGCGHVWNTFETRGRCPACGIQWEQTACLKCGEWSVHDAWYEAAPRDE